jgi:hypothetical protein
MDFLVQSKEGHQLGKANKKKHLYFKTGPYISYWVFIYINTKMIPVRCDFNLISVFYKIFKTCFFVIIATLCEL